MNDRIEIRMLGRLFVRRSNGDVVEPYEWSTGKTTDLLRLLALNGNRPVSVDSLIEKLWPDVDEVKARASLRTAASRVRQALGEACIERHLGGLILHNVWVDVVAFQTLVHDATVALHARDCARVVSLAREAEALYVADFHAYDDKSMWASEVRDSLKMSRQSLLADAGECAVNLLWMRDAIDFASLAIAEDSCFERPHRTLMRAHGGLGEVELALRAFEHCRACLSQELGADPSPQTRALHIQILSGDIEQITIKPFVGRGDEVESLAKIISESIAGDGCDVVCLAGPVGSGRTALLEAAAARVPHTHLRQVLDDGNLSWTARKVASLVSDRQSDITVWGKADGEPVREMDGFVAFLSDLDPDSPHAISILTSDDAADLLEARLADTPITLRRQSTGAISDADLATLASAALSGTVTPRLLRELGEESGRLAGRAVSILREWIASGWIIWTISGLDLFNDAAAVTGMPPVGDYFRTILERITLEETEFCQLLAIIDRPISAETSLGLSVAGSEGSADLDQVEARLDELADLGILRVTTEGYEFRNRSIRDAFEHRLRPAVKARLMRRIGLQFEEAGTLQHEYLSNDGQADR
jgi:DNA-binding SARP family transcriptional activator